MSARSAIRIRLNKRRKKVTTVHDVIRIGRRPAFWADLYHVMLTISWPVLFLAVAGVFAVANVAFALAYLMGGEPIANARPGSFLDAFFFSVQTMATIGYGYFYPRTVYAESLVTLEAMFGPLLFALTTGLAFSRFARPTARVEFSRHAVVTAFEGVPTLMFRTANRRNNEIVEARVKVSLLRAVYTKEGDRVRRFYDLTLLRDSSPFFTLTWQIMHPVDERSPLFGLTGEEMRKNGDILLVSLTGIDDIFAQTVLARHIYTADQIRWNHRLGRMLTIDDAGRNAIDFDRIHDVEPDRATGET